MKPYYSDSHVTIYHGNALEVLATLNKWSETLVTDPPYGIAYASSKTGHDGGTALPGIAGDESTALRDAVLSRWIGPCLVFGSWKRPRPRTCRMILIWDKGDHVGMGDLSLPWKPNTEEIYVIGKGFKGHRGTSVLRYRAAVTWNSRTDGRKHPHEKPVDLMAELVGKCPPGVEVCDPFMGTGSTLAAAKRLGRRATGIEIDEKFCEIAVKRLGVW